MSFKSYSQRVYTIVFQYYVTGMQNNKSILIQREVIYVQKNSGSGEGSENSWRALEKQLFLVRF
jgi:hypothetical protein